MTTASDVDEFLAGVKEREREALLKEQTRAKRRMAEAREEFKKLLPRIIEADRRGEKKLEFGVGEAPSGALHKVFSEHGMRVSFGGSCYMSDPPQYNLIVEWY